ncbi:MAG: corrinoid protein [Thermoanaerobaculales bacterium]|nr:corrinoid protein [Thermoanaerobaculales bacterium]
MDLLGRIADDLELGLNDDVRTLVRQAIDARLSASTILNDGLLAGMAVVGRRFKAHEIFLPDVLLAARAMHAGLELLEPFLASEDVRPRGTVILGTVAGDQHDIGKTLVGIMLRGAGYEVVDLGIDVDPETFVDAALEHRASIIGLSALLTTTMPAMGVVVRHVKERQLAGKIQTLVGGAPVTREFALEIGADAYAYDAASAVETVEALMDSRRC